MSELEPRIPPQIKNLNEAFNDQFKLVLNDIRETTYHIQTISLPGVSQNPAQISYPQNNTFVNGNKLTYEPLVFSFKVDEDLNNWMEIYSWLIGITAPQNFEQFEFFQQHMNHFGRSGYVTSVDASLIQLTQVYNPNIEIQFVNVMPESLSGLDFTLAGQGEPLVAQASFRYDYYVFKKKGSLK